ncbi:MAG: exo-alpha-sialidase [Balneolaceae bacterium]|nr:exo-alpha-sialidase [Balneolaceae bacterium]
MRSILLIILFPALMLFASSTFAQSTASVSVHKPLQPIFKGETHNPVLKIEVLTTRTDVVADGITLELGRSTSDYIEQVQIFYTGSENEFSAEEQIGSSTVINETMSIPLQKPLHKGRNYFWVSVELNDMISLTDLLEIDSKSIQLNGSEYRAESDRPNTALRPAKKIRKANEDGVHTYRIPGMVTSNEGTLLAVYDVRYDDSSDLQGDIDVGLSRSTDGGETWEPMEIIIDMGEWGGRPVSENGIGDPAILVDRNNGTIWVSALWIHGYPGTHAWFSSQQGMNPEETGQFMLVKSEDDGQTWSDPINITNQIKQPEWHLLLMGPGNGITMKDGTLVFAAQYKDENEMPWSTIVYSKDQGETWEIGSPVRSNTTEAQVVELDEGRLMINMRDNRGGARSVYTTSDMGETWHEHSSSRLALQEPVSMASLIQSNPETSGYDHNYLLFSNPNSTAARVNMTLKLSKDQGRTWPVAHQLLLDENRGFGYSSLTMVDEETVGILYEGVRDLYFQKIKLDELLGR